MECQWQNQNLPIEVIAILICAPCFCAELILLFICLLHSKAINACFPFAISVYPDVCEVYVTPVNVADPRFPLAIPWR